MKKLLSDCLKNLRMGLRVCCFLPVNTSQFVINSDQLVALILLDLLLVNGLDCLLALPDPVFDSYALPTYALGQLAFLLQAYVIAKLWKKTSLFLTLSVLAFAVSPLLQALIHWDYYLERGKDLPDSNYVWWAGIISFYNIVVLGRSIYIAANRKKFLTAVFVLVTLAAASAEFAYFGDYQKFWNSDEPEEQTEADPWLEYRNMDAEQLMYQQPSLLAKTLAALQTQQPSKTEWFFVGFAAYATEDVFSKEVNFAKTLVDKQFATAGHSLNLINHLKTRDTIPLATATNLAASLKHLGALMDKDNDVLMLYLTSHGSKQHQLKVSFWPLALNDITPKSLHEMLDAAGIKWRVLLVSSCYSGGYINELANDTTVVATASAADKTSFGCGSESEFTYFGEALFKDALAHQPSIIKALQQAQQAIGEREKREQQEPSLPQLSVGKLIAAKLDNLVAN